jgi:hypothetical protein
MGLRATWRACRYLAAIADDVAVATIAMAVHKMTDIQ